MFSHLKLGSTVENPVFWKKVQFFIIILGAALPLLVLQFPSLQVIIDKDVLAQTVAGIASVIAYLTVATTDKLGL